MIITHIIRDADTVHMCDADGLSINMTPSEWAAFLTKRGAVSLPFDINLKEVGAQDR